jgi:hypothetical protein
VTRIESAPAQRPIEISERAFNTVLEPDRTRNYRNAHEALASALNFGLEEALAFIAAEKRIPVARCQSLHEAELIAALIRTCGFRSTVVADEDFKLDTELTRARRITQLDDALEVHSSGGGIVVESAEIRLLVVGSWNGSRVDYTEGIAGSREQSAAVKDSFEFQSDETLLDVYTDRLDKSFRVRSSAFDYSGLVHSLSFRAEENFRKAVNSIASVAPGALVDNDFQRLRRLLTRVWPERSRTESRGFKRAGLARRPVAQSSVMSDNRDQFDRYSRLMFLSVAAAPAAAAIN